MVDRCCFAVDEQGTPVRIRDGPAAVTEHAARTPGLITIVVRVYPNDEKVSVLELGSQKTYRRVTSGPLRGTGTVGFSKKSHFANLVRLT